MSIFIRVLAEQDKGMALADVVAAANAGRQAENVYIVRPDSFRQVPNTPFCYWVSERIRRLFKELPPFEGEGRTVRQGLATADDFRFVRAWWEVPAERILDSGQYAVGRRRKAEKEEKEKWTEERIREFQAWCRRRTCEGKRWVPFAKGGEYSPYYADIHLVVNWEQDGTEMKVFSGSVIRNPDYYFRPGLTWTYRTNVGFSVRCKPANTIHGHVGHSAFPDTAVATYLGWFNSLAVAHHLLRLLTTYKWEVGYVRHLPIPNLSNNVKSVLNRSMHIACLKQLIDSSADFSHAFTLPALLQVDGETLAERGDAWSVRTNELRSEIAHIQAEIDKAAFNLYGFTEEERRAVVSGPGSVMSEGKTEGQESAEGDEDAEALNSGDRSVTAARYIADLLSWCVGVAFGRFDVRLALDPSLVPDEPDPFDPLPVCPPGMLVGPDGLPAKPGCIVSEEWLRARPDANTLPPEGTVSRRTIPDSEYPLRINWDGILVDDPGFNGARPHRDDIVRRVREVLDLIWGDRAQEIEQEACEILGVRELRDYFRKPSGFFQDHLKRYSKSRRKAPIYWPLSTASGSYTIWLYYHRLTDQTLYAAVNKYLEPKIADTERVLDRLEEELAAASGREATRLRDRLNEGRAFLGELQDLREELLRVAGLPYKPDLNDGVIINAAPLHKLFRLRSWAKETEKVWKKLEKGDYDWAHMAYTIWPDRVREVCRRDRSIAIAHGLEDICEVEPPASKKKGGRGRRRKEAAR